VCSPIYSCLGILSGFHSCPQLFRIAIPASVEIITLSAFSDCNSLSKVIFPTNSRLKTLGGFHSCTQLFRIEIPASVEIIDLNAFSNCDSLHGVVFAPGFVVQTIHGFSTCESLSRIEIPNGSSVPDCLSVTEYQKFLVFRKMSDKWSMLFEMDSGCYMIDEPLIDIAEITEREIVSVDGEAVSISSISDRLFCLYVLRSIEIPSFIKSIGSCLRWIEMKIPMLVIPSSIETIDGFYGFFSVEVVKFALGSCVREIRGFHCCKSLRQIEIAASAEIIAGFHSCHALTEIIFENDSRIREICGFRRCELLPRIEIPASAEFINAFDDCASLTEIKVPVSVATLQGFNNCFNLRAITFAPNCGLRIIEGFDGCLVDSITVPVSVESIKGFEHNSLRQLILTKGTKMKIIKAGDISWELNICRPRVFVACDEEDLKKSRRRLSSVR
jgi:hypothetical protein